MTRTEAAFVTVAAFAIGVTFPDIDQMLGIGHRSGLTHSLLPALLLLRQHRWHPAACGLGGGTGLHLAADTFPNAMIGYATVKLPLLGSIGATASYAWLAINAVAALLLAATLALRLHPPAYLATVAGVTLIGGVGYLWAADGGWPVLAIAAALAGAGWRWRRVE